MSAPVPPWWVRRPVQLLVLAGLVAAVLGASLIGGAERQLREADVVIAEGPAPPEDPQ